MGTRNMKKENAPTENTAEKKLHFEKLSPIDTADIDVYEDAIQFAFENKDIKNIAISGAYGSGKSSLLASYKKRHPEKEFIHISLAHFESQHKEKHQVELNKTPQKSLVKTSNNTLGESSEQQKTSQRENCTKHSESVLEGKILNQLIHQLKAENIPQTNFRVKKTLTKAQTIWQSIAIISLIVTVIHLALSSVWINFVASFTPGCWFRNILDLTTTPGSFFVSGCVGLIIVSYFIATSVKRQRFKATIRKLSLQGNDIELFESENDSFFDKYLNEVLYLFENASVDAIVFEDMDRYDMEGIFERLHEVNTLANIRLRRKEKKPIRFFFLLRDDLFVSKDRTKFFDYIIPVIPIVDSSNSYDQFIKLTSANNLNNLFKDKFLQGVSLFIDDMRLLKNICNEFLIYYKRLGGTELDPNKLLAIIVYKNIFPRDFSELQINQGFVFALFSKKNEFIEAELAKLQEEAKQIETEISRIQEEHLVSQREVDAVFVDKYYKNNSLLDYDDAKLTAWLNKYLSDPELSEYTTRKEHLKKKLSNALEELEEKRLLNLEEQQKLQQKKLSQIIGRENSKQIFSIINQNALGETTAFEDVKRNQYFNLLKYLITEGYIDETYADYLTYFYPHSITTADKVFLQRVANKTTVDYAFELRKPELVFEKLNIYDFDEPETLNFSLLTYILTHEPAKECVERLIGQLRTTEKYDFIAQYLARTSEKEKFIIAINTYWPGFFKMAAEKHMLSKQQLWEYSHDILYYSSDDDIEQVNIDGCLERYISSQPDYLNAPPEKYEKLMRRLVQLGVKFQKIDYAKSDHDFFMLVYEQSCYVLNYDNIELMLQIVYCIAERDDIRHKNFTLICANTDSALYKYIIANIEVYVGEMLGFCNDIIRDDAEIALDLLNNSVLPESMKNAYIGRLTTNISVLADVNEKTLWAGMLNAGVAENNESNIWAYWEESGIDNVLSSFINDNDTGLNFRPLIDQYGRDKGSKWFSDVMACNDIRTDKYIEILKSCGFYHSNGFAITGIADEKMELLIDKNLVRLSEESLKFIRANYPSALYRFIRKHFDDYVEGMSKSLFDHTELLEVLSWDVPDEQKLKLLTFANKPISIVDKGYSTSVTMYILQNRRDINDMPQLCLEYSYLADEIKPIVIDYAQSKVDNIINGSLDSSNDLKLMLLGHSNISESNKYRLLLKMLASVDKSQGKLCFERMLLNEFSKIFVAHAKPKIPKSDQNKRILDVLVNRGWIYDYPEYQYDSNYYTVRRNAPSKKRDLTKV